MLRTFTNNFILDVDYAFRGRAQRSYAYWIGHISVLLFFCFRSIFILNTPNIVHVPRTTFEQNILQDEEYYQFRNDLKKEEPFIDVIKPMHRKKRPVAELIGDKLMVIIVLNLGDEGYCSVFL